MELFGKVEEDVKGLVGWDGVGWGNEDGRAFEVMFWVL